MDFIKRNWFSLLLLVLAIVAFIIGYQLVIKPLNADIVSVQTELRLKKAELEIAKQEVLAAERLAAEASASSDSLYKDWQIRQNNKQEDKQYEKDVHFISNSSFNERVNLLSDWLSTSSTGGR